MTLASTSRVSLAYAEELVFGETPTTGDHKPLRYTGESLSFSLTKEVSEEINEYRGSSSMIPVSAEASGTVNGEMQYAEYDNFIQAVLQDTWKPYGTNGVGDVFEATISATTITATVAPTGTSELTNLRKGQWFFLQGTVLNSATLFRVSSVTAPTATVIVLDPGTPGVPEAAVATAKISTSRLSNGVTQRSFSLQKHAADVGEYFLYRGMTASRMNLSLATASRTTVDFDFMGRDSEASSTNMLPGNKGTSKGFQIMSGVAGSVCTLWYGGAPLVGTFINSLSMSYDNALRMQNALCSLGAVGIGSGTIAVELTAEVFFASGRVFYDEFLQNQNKEVAFTCFDVDGNGYVFTLPVANVSTYSVTAGSRDAELMASITFTGLMDLSTADPELRGKVLLVDRVGAAAT